MVVVVEKVIVVIVEMVVLLNEKNELEVGVVVFFHCLDEILLLILDLLIPVF